jgi:RNA polymerase sigma factor (TIGR02999 family)
MSDVTRILSAIEQGDSSAAEQLLPLVYDELRQLAAQRLAQEKPGQTLQATALVHEAYLRLVVPEQAQNWNSKGHFFAAAAEAMRRILVENARRKGSQKRGGDRGRENFDVGELAAPALRDDLLALDEALHQLAGAIDGTVRLWDPSGDRPRSKALAGIPPMVPWLHGVALSPEGRHLAVCNPNDTVYVLRLAQAGEVFGVPADEKK